MIGFTGTSLQLQLIITARTFKSVLTTSVWRISLKNLGLISATRIHECTAFYNFHAPPKVPLLLFMNALPRKPCVNSETTVRFCVCYPLLRNITCLATCYIATTRSLLFLVTGTWFPIRCSGMGVCSGSTIPAFRRHVTIRYVFHDRVISGITWFYDVVRISDYRPIASNGRMMVNNDSERI
jgi:hypothetical protein